MVAALEEAAETPEERRAAQAAAVRSVMEQLHSENRFGALRSNTAAAVTQSSVPFPHGVQPRVYAYLVSVYTENTDKSPAPDCGLQ